MNPHFAADGTVIPSFLHTSPDATKNQPIRKQELEDAGNENKRFDIITGGKANRAQRRKWANNKKKGKL